MDTVTVNVWQAIKIPNGDWDYIKVDKQYPREDIKPLANDLHCDMCGNPAHFDYGSDGAECEDCREASLDEGMFGHS